MDKEPAEDLAKALDAMVTRFGTAPWVTQEEKPATFACNHAAETCPNCEWMVGTWKDVRNARAVLAAYRATES